MKRYLCLLLAIASLFTLLHTGMVRAESPSTPLASQLSVDDLAAPGTPLRR
jgi:hypothetical protein